MKIFYTVLFIFLSSAQGSAAFCTQTKLIIDSFEDKFDEVPAAIGNTGGNQLVLLLAEDGSFSLIKIYPEGIACIVDYGTDWKMITVKGVRS